MTTVQKLLNNHQEATFPLQITSMIDMFTIILVFLLKSYASSSVDITPSQTMRLPSSTSLQAPAEALKLMVSKDAIFVDDKEVMRVDGTVAQDKSKLIKPLYDALTIQATKSKNIGTKNESAQFDGKVIMQADQTLNYQYLQKVMYTAALAGYTDFKFAVIAK